MEIADGVQQHPFGHIVLAAVLPRGEPEQYETNIMLASFGQEPVDRRKVELPGLLFNLIPVDRYFDRVGMQVFHGSPVFWVRRPGTLQAQVLILYTQYQKWSIVHEQSEASVLLHQAGNRALGDLGVERADDECGRQSGQNSGSRFHLSSSCVVLGEYAVGSRLTGTPGNPGGVKTGAPPGFEQIEIAAPSLPGFPFWLPTKKYCTPRRFHRSRSSRFFHAGRLRPPRQRPPPPFPGAQRPGNAVLEAISQTPIRQRCVAVAGGVGASRQDHARDGAGALLSDGRSAAVSRVAPGTECAAAVWADSSVNLTARRLY